MIESSFWRPELRKTATNVKRLSKFDRWSEKRAVLLEREVMLAMFCVRTFIENKKIPDNLAQKKLHVGALPTKCRGVNRRNRFDVYENYDFEKEEQKQVSLEFLCNQLIHSYIIFPLVGQKRFTHLIVCSDYEKNRFLYRVAIIDLILITREVADTGVTEMTYYGWDKKREDFQVATKGGNLRDIIATTFNQP